MQWVKRLLRRESDMVSENVQYSVVFSDLEIDTLRKMAASKNYVEQQGYLLAILHKVQYG